MPKSYNKILLFKRTRIRQHKIFFIFWTRITYFAYLTTVIHLFYLFPIFCFVYSEFHRFYQIYSPTDCQMRPAQYLGFAIFRNAQLFYN